MRPAPKQIVVATAAEIQPAIIRNPGALVSLRRDANPSKRAVAQTLAPASRPVTPQPTRSSGNDTGVDLERAAPSAQTPPVDERSDVVALARSVGLRGFAEVKKQAPSEQTRPVEDGSDVVALARSVGLRGFAEAPAEGTENGVHRR